MTLLDTTLPKILGACFYYHPTSETLKTLIPVLNQLNSLFPWPSPEQIHIIGTELSQTNPNQLEPDFTLLFEGPGHMPAPPWASVYLDEDNLLMGKTTLDYRFFLSQHGIDSLTKNTEPDDQFGLMLLAFTILLEQKNKSAAIQLLEQHLLPWAPRYLNCIRTVKTQSPFYHQLAQITTTYLNTLNTQLTLNIKPRQLHF